jgi:hypothetical protein
MQLQAVISQRPGFQDQYELQQDADTDGFITSPKAGFTMANTYRDDPLWWCLLQLLGPPDDQQKFPTMLMLEFLNEHLATASRAERSRLDEVLFEKLSDYATVMELLAAVRMHFPKCTIRAADEILKAESRLAWRRTSSKKIAWHGHYETGQQLRQFQKLTPPSGRRDHSWLQAFDAGHASLQRFWGSMKNLYETYYRKCGWATQDIETTMNPIKHWESIEHRELLDRKRKEILMGIEKKDHKVQAKDDVFPPLLSGVSETPARPKVIMPAAKEKTKPSELVQRPAEDSLTADNQQPPAATAVVVSKRSLSVLRSMFPTMAEDRKGGVDWDTFVQSMENAGFTARNG